MQKDIDSNNTYLSYCLLMLLFLLPQFLLAQDETANPKRFYYSSDLQQRADEGDRVAQFQLGYCYYYNKNSLCKNNPLKRDSVKAFKYLKQSADQGHVYALYCLSRFYHKYEIPGYVEKNEEQAMALALEAANKGCIQAMSVVGYNYHEGLGTNVDYERALYYTRKAAEGGNGGANYGLAYWYWNGLGVEKDLRMSTYYLLRALDRNNSQAKSLIKKRFDNGWKNASRYSSYEEWLEALRNDVKNYMANRDQTDSNENKQQQPQIPEEAEINIDKDIPLQTIKNKTSFAVIIGNERYQRVANVPFAVNDARIFAEYCKKTLGIPDVNVRMYENATYGTILSAIADIKRIADAYDGKIHVIFYYAGHGIPSESSREGFLLPSDADGQQLEACYSLSRLYKELNELETKSVVVFLDACFSGAQRGNGMLASTRGVAIKTKIDAPSSGNVFVFTAATGDETAYPFKEQNHGLFTYYLLRKLNETSGNCTLQELCDYVQTNVKQRSVVINRKSQTPTVIPSAGLADSWKTMKLK